MKLVEYFGAFLTDVVNLNQNRLDQLEGRVTAIVNCLKADPVIGPKIRTHIPQGSWPHRTIIRPLPNKEFDADFLLSLHEDEEWSKSPKIYLQQLRAAFIRSSTYKDMVTRKNRCVRIVYANDCHVDVVPHLVLEEGKQVIMNYDTDSFEETNPEGFTDWMKEKDGLAKGNLRRVIRLMKYLRDFKGTFSCPSVILTTLLGERVQAFDEDSRYGDVPTALLNLVSDLNTWLQLYPMMPTIEDPSCPGTSFNHRWEQAKYENFRKQIAYYAGRIKEAYEATDIATSLALWQKVFGDDFKKPVTAALQAATVAKSASTGAVQRRAPAEQFIEEKGFTFAGGRKAHIRCSVARQRGFRDGDLRKLRTVEKGRSLEFRLTTDVPEPYELYWKVRNTGAEAEQAGGLRGQIVKDEGRRRRVESTLWRGRHYVEAYVVKNGRVVATDRHDVTIV